MARYIDIVKLREVVLGLPRSMLKRDDLREDVHDDSGETSENIEYVDIIKLRKCVLGVPYSIPKPVDPREGEHEDSTEIMDVNDLLLEKQAEDSRAAFNVKMRVFRWKNHAHQSPLNFGKVLQMSYIMTLDKELFGTWAVLAFTSSSHRKARERWKMERL